MVIHSFKKGLELFSKTTYNLSISKQQKLFEIFREGKTKKSLELFSKSSYNQDISKQQKNLLKQKGTFKKGLELKFESVYNQVIK